MAPAARRVSDHDLVERIQHTTKLDRSRILPASATTKRKSKRFSADMQSQALEIFSRSAANRPAGMAYDKSRDSFQHAIDLVKFVRCFNESGAHPHRHGFGSELLVSRGTSGHPNRLVEMDYFKAKVDRR